MMEAPSLGGHSTGPADPIVLKLGVFFERGTGSYVANLVSLAKKNPPQTPRHLWIDSLLNIMVIPGARV